MIGQELHYLVVLPERKTVLNRVRVAPNELDVESLERRNAKRQAHAERLASRWSDTLYKSDKIEVKPIGIYQEYRW